MPGSVLTKYDFRTKQQYIYRTNRVLEISGASLLITTMYDRMLSVLAEHGLPVRKNYKFEDNHYKNYADQPFSPDLADDAGTVLYVGGGNLYVLWKNRETALEASRLMCKTIRKEAYGLSLVCGIADFTGDYDHDIKMLNADFERCKALVPPPQSVAVLPFTELDRKTSLPITRKRKDERRSLSYESDLKLKMAQKVIHDQAVLDLDGLVTDKGDESLLAVIYIDGNNMGKRVCEALSPQKEPIIDYVKAVRIIRELSNNIQTIFVDKPLKAIQSSELLAKKQRLVIAGGDEMTLICNARDALTLIEIYFDAVRTSNPDSNPYENTSCAGICIFHSHFPFATAYKIADECCANAKKENRKRGGQNMLVDFQFCYSGVTGDLEAMRKHEKQFMNRPYLVYGTADSIPKLSDFKAVANRLKEKESIGRANIKDLSMALFEGEDAYELIAARLDAQYPGRLRETDRRFMLDVAQFFDIWFGEERV